MPLGSQEGPDDTAYRVVAQSVAMVGDYHVTFTCVPSTDNLDATGVIDIVQKFVDLVSSSTNFTLSGASRTYSYSQQITPTA